MNKKLKYWSAYFLLWVFCYLLYPCWLIPGSPLKRYIWLLSFFIYFGVLSILYFKKVEIPEGGSPCAITLLKQRDWGFIGAAIVFVLLHIYPLWFLPLRTWADEPSHACSGIQILQAVSQEFIYSSFKFKTLQWFLRLAVLTGIIAIVKYKPWKYFSNCSFKQKIFWMIIPVFLLSHLLFFLLKEILFYGYLYKPPPLSRWLSLGVTTLTQLNVFWVRLPSLSFCLLSSALIYEMVAALSGDKKLAGMSGTLFLFLPNISYYSSSADLSSGTVFFSLLPLYFLICFLKSKNYSSLHWCFFWAAAGFLWKRPLLTGEIYLIGILAVYHLFVEPISLKKSFIYWSFSLGIILPFFLMGQFLIKMPFQAAKIEKCVYFVSLFDPGLISMYFSSIPKEIGFAGLVLFCAGLLLFFAQKAYLRKFWPLAISFLCWYIALTASLTAGASTLPPWQLPLYPFIAVCSAFCFRSLIGRWKKAGLVVFGGYLLFIISCSTFLHFSPVHKEYALYRTDFENPTHLGGFLPYEKMILYMKEYLPSGSKVLADDFPDPREFYSFKHHLNVEWKLVKYRDELIPGVEDLYKKAKSEEASYLFLPEPGYAIHMDRAALEAVFEERTPYFSLMKVSFGPGGRVGLFNVL